MESRLDKLGVYNRNQEQGDRCRQVEPLIGQWEILNLVVDPPDRGADADV